MRQPVQNALHGFVVQVKVINSLWSIEACCTALRDRLSLEGTFTATDQVSTLLFHVEPGETALFDKVSVHSTSYHHDEHHLVPTKQAPLLLQDDSASSEADGAYCESIDGAMHLAEVRTQADCDTARGIWIRTSIQGGRNTPTELSVAQRQHTYDTALLLRWFAHVISLRVLKSHTFYGVYMNSLVAATTPQEPASCCSHLPGTCAVAMWG